MLRNGKETLVTDILSCFERDKENTALDFKLDSQIIGYCIQELFGNNVIVKRRFTNVGNDHNNIKKVALYQNLYQEKFSAQQDAMQVKSTQYGWCLLEKTDSSLIFSKLTDIFVNDNRLTLDLEIGLVNKSILLNGFNGNKLNGEDIGIKQSDIREDNIPFLLYFLSMLSCCVGFGQDDRSSTVIRTETDPLCIKVIVRTPHSESYNIISRRCRVFICSEKLSSKLFCCTECSTTKKRLMNRKTEYENLKKTKNILLGKNDVKLKTKILKNDRKNACKKAQYWQEKFNAENICIDKEDHSDLCSMFSAVDETKVPEGFELLMSQQKKSLTVKGSSGRRWHPK